MDRFKSGRLRLVAALVAVLVAGIVALAASPAGAHTALLTSSPASGQTVGGDVDFLDLVFLEPVSEVVITLTGPDRELVPGQMTVDEGQIIRYSMDPLIEAGRYIVRYSMISADEDLTTSGFYFEYRPEALTPARLGELDIPPTPLFTIQRVAIGVLGASMLGMLGLQLVSLRRKKELLTHRRSVIAKSTSSSK